MIQIIIGILALGLVIIVHEAGHFAAARLCGVVVETFSIGWGPVLFKKKIGTTEYRISALPLGGYCGMKGENAFHEAVENKLDAIPREEGSFYGVHPLKRICIAFAGPFANLLLAVFAFSLVSAAGYTYYSYDTRIIPASLYGGPIDSPADKAGFAEGDKILSIDGIPVHTYSDIQQYVSVRPDEDIRIEYERNSTVSKVTVRTLLDKSSASGKLGIYAYVPLVIGSVAKDSAADSAGIRSGDRITEINGVPVAHIRQLYALLKDKPEQIHVTLDRGGMILPVTLVLLYGKDDELLSGITWDAIQINVPGTGPAASIHKGFSDTARTAALTVKSIGMLFRGVHVSEAVSGPVRITMMIGEAASNGFAGFAELLSIICISLFIMNLLPIPVLDGGLILLSLPELLTGKPLKPTLLYYVQFIGIAFIVCIFMLALVSDIRFLSK